MSSTIGHSSPTSQLDFLLPINLNLDGKKEMEK
jgi:hypothetical protein